MRKKMKPAIGIIAFGLFLVASPFLISHAQKKSELQKEENKNQDEQELQARAETAKSVVGSIFLDALPVKEPSWVLNKAGFVERGENNKFTYLSMLLKKGDSFTGIDILECDSPKDADERFGGQRSYGASVPFNKYGDKGDKLIGQNGDLMAIRFRKGNFFVVIYTRSDSKTAEHFAEYALEAIKSYVPNK